MKFGIETHDLLPYSVGISLYNGIIMKIVDGKSNYPCSGNHVFNTVSDNQKTIRVMAYEGDRKLARNCNPIGILYCYFENYRTNYFKLKVNMLSTIYHKFQLVNYNVKLHLDLTKMVF
jgi:tRNA(Ile2) C34 agmatinyltransferase TiaS